ncbi:hypothetical protein PVAG01_01652 [Phlyctema vagabunda]|uniref:Opioid growth factor receptor (OGFr) conserved domain-containing protein n=1 Tax=Phlyctema vagabunda TaxID=108571 RepID=A0ABR4PXP6_9HELO
MAPSTSKKDVKIHPIIAFYKGGTDDYGRTLDQILAWSDRELEMCHNYIQRVFPLPEESGVSWSAPIITREVFDAFRADPKLRDQLHRSYKRLAEFYGFKIVKGKDIPPDSRSEDDADVKVIDPEQEYLITQPPEIFARNSESWLTPFDHNHLRITRIIRCLRVLGLEAEAKDFHQALWRCSRRPRKGKEVSQRTIGYWDRALRRPLNIEPDDDGEDTTTGPDFLVEYEASLAKDKETKPRQE